MYVRVQCMSRIKTVARKEMYLLTAHDALLPVQRLRAVLLALARGRGAVEGGHALREAGAAYALARVVVVAWKEKEISSLEIGMRERGKKFGE